jgi:transcription termination/antitermination protein NusA
VKVADDQQSLAIGRGGQNVRLAAKLTGWRIDIQSVGGESVAKVSQEGEADSAAPAQTEATPSE